MLNGYQVTGSKPVTGFHNKQPVIKKFKTPYTHLFIDDFEKKNEFNVPRHFDFKYLTDFGFQKKCRISSFGFGICYTSKTSCLAQR